VRWEVVAKSAASCNDHYFWLLEINGFWGAPVPWTIDDEASRDNDSSQTISVCNECPKSLYDECQANGILPLKSVQDFCACEPFSMLKSLSPHRSHTQDYMRAQTRPGIKITCINAVISQSLLLNAFLDR